MIAKQGSVNRNRHDGDGNKQERSPGDKTHLTANAPPSIKQAAEMMNVSESMVRSAIFVQEHGSKELNDAVSAGDVSLSRAELVVRNYPTEQHLEKAKNGDRSELGYRHHDEEKRSPSNSTHLTVKQITEQYGVSERTARRHRKRGTLPSQHRRIGRDGKTYPAYGQSHKVVNCHRELRDAFNAIHRFRRTARFNLHDIDQLREIVNVAADMVGIFEMIIADEEVVQS